MRRIVPALLAITHLALAATPADKLVQRVQDRVRKLQPTREEKKIDEVGWAPTIVDALLLARQHNRPIFLFTHDGNIATGRC